MTEAIGNFALAAAILSAMGAILASITAARFDSEKALGGARWLIGIFAAFVTLATGALTYAMVNSDFRIAYVSHYSEKALPMGYKLAAVWAGAW